jgi:hypothetical protein
MGQVMWDLGYLTEAEIKFEQALQNLSDPNHNTYRTVAGIYRLLLFTIQTK